MTQPTPDHAGSPASSGAHKTGETAQADLNKRTPNAANKSPQGALDKAPQSALNKAPHSEADKAKPAASEHTAMLAPRPDMVAFHHFAAVVSRQFFRWYGKGRVIGLENVPREGALIFAANHASDLDPFLAWAVLRVRRKMWGVAKTELYKHPLSRYVMHSVGAIPVKRGTADRAMIRTTLDLLAKGECVGLFPEGTRSKDGGLQAPQAGIGLLVHKSGAPVVPVGISGTHKMLPVGGKVPKRARLTIQFGTPLHFGPDKSREQIAAEVMDAISKLIVEENEL